MKIDGRSRMATRGRPPSGRTETCQVTEFKLIDDHGEEYTVFEYQEGTESLSLKWREAGPTWFRLSDGTAVDKLDDNTFKIPMIDRVLHRQA